LEVLFGFLLITAPIFGILGGWIAKQKNRDPGEGFVLGCLFGPLGAIIEALLPSMPGEGQKPPERVVIAITPEEAELMRQQEAERQAKAAAKEAELEDLRRTRQAEVAAREAAVAAFNKQEQERLAREEQEKKRRLEQKRAARRERLAAIPERVKIVVGVAGGLLGMITAAAIVLFVAGKSMTRVPLVESQSQQVAQRLAQRAPAASQRVRERQVDSFDITPGRTLWKSTSALESRTQEN
jgi:hypothetical protein